MADIKNTVVTDFVANTAKATKNVESLTDTQKKNEKQTKKQASTLKNTLGGALGGLQNQVAGATGSMGSMITQVFSVVKSFKSLRLAIIGTGIGALVIGLVAIGAAFAKTQVGADKISQVMAAIGATVDVVINRIASLREAVNIFFFEGGGLSKAIDSAAESFKGMGDEIAEAAKAAQDLVIQRQAFRDTERAINLELAQNASKIQDLIFLTRDSTKSFEEQRVALAEASRLEVENEEKRLEIAKQKVDFAQQELDNVAGELENQDKLNDLNQAKINLLNIQSSSRAKQREILNRQNEFENKVLSTQKAQTAEIEKQEALKVAAQLKKDEQAEKDRLAKEREDQTNAEIDAAAFASLNAIFDAREQGAASQIEIAEEKKNQLLDIERLRIKEELALFTGRNSERLVLIEQHNDKVTAIKKKAAVEQGKITKANADSEVTLALGVAETISGLVFGLFGESKNAALAEVAFNTAIGIAKAVQAGAGLLWPANLGAILSGVAAVAAGIGGAKAALDSAPDSLARGGMLRGAAHSHRSGGIRINAEHGEAVINKKSMANPTLRRAASRINQAGGGVAFAQNGILAGQSSVNASIRGLSNEFEKTIKDTPPVLVTEDFNDVNNRVRVTEETATL